MSCVVFFFVGLGAVEAHTEALRHFGARRQVLEWRHTLRVRDGTNSAQVIFDLGDVSSNLFLAEL